MMLLTHLWDDTLPDSLATPKPSPRNNKQHPPGNNKQHPSLMFDSDNNIAKRLAYEPHAKRRGFPRTSI